MPDLLAGSTVRALDTPVTVADTQNDLYTTTVTVFGVGTSGGIYNDCGVAFVAPTTGRVIVQLAADLDNGSTAASTNVAPVVREGSTVGSGTEVVAADLANAIRNVGTDNLRFGSSVLVEGLTAGSSYNVRLEHRVSANTGSIQYRHVIVQPAT